MLECHQRLLCFYDTAGFTRIEREASDVGSGVGEGKGEGGEVVATLEGVTTDRNYIFR